jgi:hypothetical protein
VNPYLEDDMASADFFATDPTDRRNIWWWSGGGRRHVGADEWTTLNLDRAFKGLPPIKPYAGTPEMFATVPDVTASSGGSPAPTKVTSTVTSVLA